MKVILRLDIYLNPRIGRDWMLPGTENEVLTQGQNEKHYLAGAFHARTGQVLWVGNGRKNSYLFCCCYCAGWRRRFRKRWNWI